MRLRNWLSVSVPACAAISLLAGALPAQPAPAPAAAEKMPMVVLLDARDEAPWKQWTASRKWRVLVAPAGADKNFDARLLALEAAVKAALNDGTVDAGRIYLAGRGEAATAVFYTAARLPDLWAAAVAVGGSPKPAIDTTRFFAANFSLVPLLWIPSGADDQALASKMKAAGIWLETRPPVGTTPESVVAWLETRHREAYPVSIDCETASPAFASCYWIHMTRFSPAARNEVLPVSRVQPGSGAVLDLGGFDFSLTDPGPGLLVTGLADKYNGPLKLKDRILALNGKPIANAKDYVETMDKTVEEKPVAVAVERGKEHLRLESRIVLPRRDEVITARVQGKYLAEEKEIQIISRTAVEMRVTIPEAWAGAVLSWNGTALTKVEHGGCWLLQEVQQVGSAKPCP